MYTRNNDLPAQVRRDLPREAQSLWRRAYNTAYEQYQEKEFASQIAWAALTAEGWKKDGDVWMTANEVEGKVVKVDADQNLVFGWAYVSIDKSGEQVVDHSGDIIDPDDLETAAYVFNLQFRESGVMHEGESVGKLVESLAVTPSKLEAMGLQKDALHQGWWLGFYIEDDGIFEKVKRGEYSMFSIQGRAVRENV